MTTPDIARLSAADHADYLGHLMQLDTAALGARFGRNVDTASLQAHALRLAGREASVIGARRFQRLVGAAEIMPVSPGRVAAISVAVELSARDAGLGTRLILAAIEVARAEGYIELWFDVPGDNPAMGRILARIASYAEPREGGRRYMMRISQAGSASEGLLSRTRRMMSGLVA